jgi:hypothetical protein
LMMCGPDTDSVVNIIYFCFSCLVNTVFCIVPHFSLFHVPE